jgi:virginiamycin B lyase
VKAANLIQRRWRPAAGACLGVIALAGVAAYVLSDSRRGVQFVEYRMQDPLDTPTAIAAAPDGTIWFTLDLAAAVGRIRNGKLERISTSKQNVDPMGMGVAPDGSAWFTDNGAHGVSRVAPSGEVETVPLETPIVRLGRLAIGTDGAVWFAEATGYSISRIKDGRLTRHVFESPRGGPYGVAVAADGTAWATLKSGDQLLRITADGEMTAFEVPQKAAVPSDVAVGRDGAVWFIEEHEGRLAMFKDGSFREFDGPGGHPVLSGLAVAEDGAVWFGMLRGSSLGRLRDGRVDVFKLPRSDARPCSLAIDGAGNVWYADISGYVGMLPAHDAAK